MLFKDRSYAEAAEGIKHWGCYKMTFPCYTFLQTRNIGDAKGLYFTYLKKYWGCYSTAITPSSAAPTMLKMQWKQEMLSSPLFYMCNRCVMMNCVAFTDEIPLLFPLSFCQPKVEILRRKIIGFSSLFGLWEKWNYFNPNITFCRLFLMWVFNLKSKVQKIQR